jgi:hypothetical protein
MGCLPGEKLSAPVAEKIPMGYRWQPLQRANIVSDEPPELIAAAMKLWSLSEAKARKRLDEEYRRLRAEYWSTIFTGLPFPITRTTSFNSTSAGGTGRRASGTGGTSSRSRTNSLGRSASASSSIRPRAARSTLPTSTIFGASPVRHSASLSASGTATLSSAR